MPFPILAGKAITDTTYEVANSCRFDKAGTAYMHKSQGTPSSRRTFTYSGWINLVCKIFIKLYLNLPMVHIIFK